MSDTNAVPEGVGTVIPAPLPPQNASLTPIVAMTPADTPRPGYTTTEFYVTLGFAVAPIVRALTGHDVAGSIDVVATGVSGIVGGVYVLSRAWLKNIHVKAANSTPDPVV